MPEPTTQPVDDLIAEWRASRGFQMSREEVEVLLAEIERLRSAIRLHKGRHEPHTPRPALPANEWDFELWGVLGATDA